MRGSDRASAPAARPSTGLVDPCTGEVYGELTATRAGDLDAVVDRAAEAGEDWRASRVADRVEALERMADAIAAREAGFADAIALPLGFPRHRAEAVHVRPAVTTARTTAESLPSVRFRTRVRHSVVVREPVGVVAGITPWNYPLLQAVNKICAAVAAGNSVVLKPSELTPQHADLLVDAVAGVLPPGLLQVVHGGGPSVGRALAAHPKVRFVSFTGSTAVGREIAAQAGADLKRVALELGGKSACVVLDDGDLPAAVEQAVQSVLVNSGQTCTALTRLVVPRGRLAEATEIAASRLSQAVVGHRDDPGAHLGPVVSAAQRERVRRLVDGGIQQGARLVTGGTAPPAGLERGFYVRPTLLGEVTADMTIAQEEVFGPVLALMAHDGPDSAVAIANATPYGLSGAVWGGDLDRAVDVVRRMRTGQVSLNGGPFNPVAPFGGVGDSGTGREKGTHGIVELTDLKSVQLADPEAAMAFEEGP